MVARPGDLRHTVSQEKEIHITALLSLKDLLGWRKKTVLFSGETLGDLLKTLSTREGQNLYDVLVENDGSVRLDYTVRLNNRPCKQSQSLGASLQSGDRLVLMPVMKFAAGG